MADEVEDDVTWMYLSDAGEAGSVARQWLCFDPADSRLLEVASLRGQAKCLLQCGRYEVDLVDRTRCPVYWKGSTSKVLRARWFWQKKKAGPCTPYEEVEQERLEQLFARKVVNKPLLLTDNVHFVVNHEPDSSAAAAEHWGKELSGLQQHRHDGKGIPVLLVRYHPSALAAREKRILEAVAGSTSSKVNRTPVHLVFVVHGIGENQWKADGYENFEQRVSKLRQRSEDLAREHHPESGRVEFLPVEWSDVVHESDLRTRVDSVTLKNVKPLRNFANGVFMDLITYMSPANQLPILRRIAALLNQMYKTFLRNNPDFDRRRVSIIGHSLGSAIVFELLANAGLAEVPKLDFEPAHFFALGSPIGFYLGLQGFRAPVSLTAHDFRLRAGRFFNIFHPLDPVAYRVEPLCHLDFGNLPPCEVPYHKQMRTEASNVAAGDAAGGGWLTGLKNKWIGGKEQVESESEMLSHIRQTLPLFGGGGRVDHVLQQGSFEGVLDVLAAYGAHTSYLDSKDCVLFMLSHCLCVPPPATQEKRSLNPFDSDGPESEGEGEGEKDGEAEGEKDGEAEGEERAIEPDEPPRAALRITPTAAHSGDTIATATATATCIANTAAAPTVASASITTITTATSSASPSTPITTTATTTTTTTTTTSTATTTIAASTMTTTTTTPTSIAATTTATTSNNNDNPYNTDATTFTSTLATPTHPCITPTSTATSTSANTPIATTVATITTDTTATGIMNTTTTTTTTATVTTSTAVAASLNPFADDDDEVPALANFIDAREDTACTSSESLFGTIVDSPTATVPPSLLDTALTDVLETATDFADHSDAEEDCGGPSESSTRTLGRNDNAGASIFAELNGLGPTRRRIPKPSRKSNAGSANPFSTP